MCVFNSAYAKEKQDQSRLLIYYELIFGKSSKHFYGPGDISNGALSEKRTPNLKSGGLGVNFFPFPEWFSHVNDIGFEGAYTFEQSTFTIPRQGCQQLFPEYACESSNNVLLANGNYWNLGLLFRLRITNQLMGNNANQANSGFIFGAGFFHANGSTSGELRSIVVVQSDTIKFWTGYLKVDYYFDIRALGFLGLMAKIGIEYRHNTVDFGANGLRTVPYEIVIPIVLGISL